MNMQVGCPKVYSKGCLKSRVELGVKSRTRQTRGQGWEPGLLSSSCQTSLQNMEESAFPAFLLDLLNHYVSV